MELNPSCCSPTCLDPRLPRSFVTCVRAALTPFRASPSVRLGYLYALQLRPVVKASVSSDNVSNGVKTEDLKAGVRIETEVSTSPPAQNII